MPSAATPRPAWVPRSSSTCVPISDEAPDQTRNRARQGSPGQTDMPPERLFRDRASRRAAPGKRSSWLGAVGRRQPSPGSPPDRRSPRQPASVRNLGAPERTPSLRSVISDPRGKVQRRRRSSTAVAIDRFITRHSRERGGPARASPSPARSRKGIDAWAVSAARGSSRRTGSGRGRLPSRRAARTSSPAAVPSSPRRGGERRLRGCVRVAKNAKPRSGRRRSRRATRPGRPPRP